MADPVTLSAIISGLVGVFTAYTQYRATVKHPEPAKSDQSAPDEDVRKGEMVAAVIEPAVTQHGTEDERADMANFIRNPQRYAEALALVLRDMAGRSPAFAQQLQLLVQQANIAPAGTTMHFDNKASNYGAQGVFNDEVRINPPRHEQE
jgi:hypothetical protein